MARTPSKVLTPAEQKVADKAAITAGKEKAAASKLALKDATAELKAATAELKTHASAGAKLQKAIDAAQKKVDKLTPATA